jgi:hypothetical protein
VNATSQRLCVWAGPALILLLLIGFGIMGFIPPPSPRLAGPEVVNLFSENQTRIQIGGVVMILGSAFLFPWCSAISVQLRRIEGHHSPLTYVQLTAGAVGAMLFLTPMLALEALTFRPELLRPDVAIVAYNFVWLFFLGTPFFAVIQNAAIALAIFLDRSAEPVFPRWLAYFNLWTALLFVPGSACYFFTSGPLAWNGVLVWWIPLTTFGIWFAVMVAQLLKSISRQVAASRPSTSVDADVSPALPSVT